MILEKFRKFLNYDEKNKKENDIYSCEILNLNDIF